MKTSTERILTTHVGSLPRPSELLEYLEAREIGRPLEQAAFDACLTGAVREIVEKQVAAGIDSVCDGELGKISYTFYVRHRLSGITAFRGSEVERPPQTAAHRDLLDHPDFMQRLNEARGGQNPAEPASVSAIHWMTSPLTMRGSQARFCSSSP